METPAIEVDDLVKTYGDTLAVDHTTLSVQPGEVVAVLGPNGAGKSTLIELMLGMRSTDSGTVRLFGQRPDSAAVKARVGAMLQDTDVPQALTVREIVALVGHYYPRSLPVEEVLTRADLTGKAGARAAQLSGGQRQRLSFAMAIAGDPDLVFLDEPTAALDVAARLEFWAQVRGLAAAGTTVLFASHNMAEVEALAERVLVVHRGRVIADGTPSHIASSVATRTVVLTTDLGDAALRALPGVAAVTAGPASRCTEAMVSPLATGTAGPVSGAGSPGGTGVRRITLATTSPEAAVRELVHSGALIDHLVVADADMETAFLHLVGGDADERAGLTSAEVAA